MTEELQKVERKSQSRASAGSKGGTAKSLKDKEARLANAIANDDVLSCHLPDTITIDDHPHSSDDIPDAEKPAPKKRKPAGLSPEFVEFWQAYPKRSGNNSRKDAAAKFTAKVKQGHDPGKIVAGAQSYAAWCDATGKTGTEYVKQAAVWLNQELWESDYSRTSGNHSPRSSGPVSNPWMEEARKFKSHDEPDYDADSGETASTDDTKNHDADRPVFKPSGRERRVASPILDFERPSADDGTAWGFGSPESGTGNGVHPRR